MLNVIYDIVMMMGEALRRLWQRVLGRIFPKPAPVRVRRYSLARVFVEDRGSDDFVNRLG